MTQKTQRTQQTKVRVLAGIPAYNEASYIGSIVLQVKQYVDEVIVVDDGSTDNTTRVAELAGAKVIRHTANKGKGSATEVQSQLYVALDQEYVNQEKFNELYSKSDEVARLISGFIRYLLNKDQPLEFREPNKLKKLREFKEPR